MMGTLRVGTPMRGVLGVPFALPTMEPKAMNRGEPIWLIGKVGRLARSVRRGLEDEGNGFRHEGLPNHATEPTRITTCTFYQRNSSLRCRFFYGAQILPRNHRQGLRYTHKHLRYTPSHVSAFSAPCRTLTSPDASP